MHRINIKPLSVNEAWQGRRFKTDKYKRFQRDCLLLLPPATVPDGKLALSLCFGVSNMASDWDNPVKPMQDILQKRYGFNDSRVERATVDKVKTAKGGEFVEFKLLPLADLASEQQTIADLAMMAAQLIRKLKHLDPGSELAGLALDLLQRKNLAGNPLR